MRPYCHQPVPAQKTVSLIRSPWRAGGVRSVLLAPLAVLAGLNVGQAASLETGGAAKCAVDEEILVRELPEGGVAARGVRTPPAPGPALREPDMDWVESTLASMTLEEKIGQMIMPQWLSGSASGHVTNYKVGGFIFLANSSTTILNAVSTLQAQTSVPLLFSIDCEAGSGARITDGTHFPYNMGLAATRRLDLAREQGRITARECRAVGIHVGFGPIVDVNTEPLNPVIGPRSYSDDPDLVSQFAQAYMEGCHEEGLLTTLKHFPGHGHTDLDSHLTLPAVTLSSATLYSTHLKPYADLIASGAPDFVMSAHVWYQAFDPGGTPWPATLSTVAMTDILRTDLGFQGVAVSDAFNMQGLGVTGMAAEAAVNGVLVGLDIILMPTVPDVFNAIRDAVLANQIPQSRIDASVRRILIMKSRVGMPESGTTVSPVLAAETLRHPDHLAVAEEIGAAAIARGRTNASDLPLQAGHKVLCLNFAASSNVFYTDPPSHFTTELANTVTNLTVQSVPASPTGTDRTSIVNSAASGGYDRIVVAIHNWKPELHANQVGIVQDLLTAGHRVICVSFGNPFHHQLFPTLENYFCGFSTYSATQKAAARVLTGQQEADAEWPVSGVPVPVTLSRWSAD